MRRPWRVICMVLVLLAVLAMATTAEAGGSSAPSLAGEVMLAGSDSGLPAGTSMFEATLRCGATAPSWWTYSASGVATGPYPGTFTETGTVYVNSTGLGETGPLISVHADFTIASGTTIVTGSKDMTMVAANTGSCLATASSYDAKFASSMSYKATIDTATGSFTDAGSASIDSERAESFDISQTPPASLSSVSRFRESFDASSGATPAPTSTGLMVGGGLTSSGVLFGVFGKGDSSGVRGLCGVFDYLHHTLVRCLNVDSFVISGSKATLTGDALVNTTRTRYRIEVTDLGDPGWRDSFKLTTDSGYATQGSVLFGGIRIHR
jgi:hypothetical protein